MSNKHAVLSASKSPKWMGCPGSIAAEAGIPDDGDKRAANIGTLAHWVGAHALGKETAGHKPVKGESYVVDDGDIYVSFDDDAPNDVIILDQEMWAHAQGYAKRVLSVGDLLSVEQSYSIEGLTGEGGAAGTPDAVVYDKAEGKLYIIDLKYGYVPVAAEGNTQLLIYAWAVAAFEYLQESAPTVEVILVIDQPRLGVVDQHSYTLDDLHTHALLIGAAAKRVRTSPGTRTPGDHCAKGWCRARATCPALSERVFDELEDDLPDLPIIIGGHVLANKLASLHMIRKWCDAVEADANRRAIDDGVAIPGFKVVSGNQGKREWSSDDEAETMLKSMRVKHDQMYRYSVISPTQAEKVHKDGGIGSRQWPKLQTLITRKDSKMQLVPDSDKRAAITVQTDESLLPDADDDLSDLV